MKILIMSDSHGNITNLNHVMGFAQKIKAGLIIHCGDWNNLESANKVTSFGIPLYAVLGNADIDSTLEQNLKLNSKKFGTEYLLENIEGKNIGITHRPRDVKKFFENIDTDIVFCGHRHSKDDTILNGIRIVRPGAITNGNNFAVYDTENGLVEFIEDE